MKINMTKPVQVEAKTLRMHVKCTDRFACTIEDQNGEVLKDYEGYVPGFFPEQHFGDYIILTIDIDTGQILNWTPPSQQDMEQFLNGDE